jgi:hypothetical protein
MHSVASLHISPPDVKPILAKVLFSFYYKLFYTIKTFSIFESNFTVILFVKMLFQSSYAKVAFVFLCQLVQYYLPLSTWKIIIN